MSEPRVTPGSSAGRGSISTPTVVRQSGVGRQAPAKGEVFQAGLSYFTPRETGLFEGASFTSRHMGKIAARTKVTVLDVCGDWLEVETEQGGKGFIVADTIRGG